MPSCLRCHWTKITFSLLQINSLWKIVHIKLCRYLLGVNKKATNTAVRPILTDFVSHSAKYWLHLVKYNPQTMVYKAYLELYKTCEKKRNWPSHIQNIWSTFSLPNVWSNQGAKYKHKIKNILATNIIENHGTQWKALLDKQDSKLRTCKSFKHNIPIENDLLGNTNITTRK